MAEKSVKRTTTELDPMFFIPEGVDEFIYHDRETTYETSQEETGDDFFVTDDGDADYFDGPATPEIIEVVSQTIRTTAAGNQVVDLVVEVEDLAGLSKYEFRVTKI